ncbi:hypothetical protein CORMATOL_02430 [Corynebacterium matruchotii ATCC 33806]|uniref:Uncharacterized protein n=1 Tax=Corynebacterium matruchotii ATCC 33806 TaxID=566549 RepID=C0E5Z8_9CORY|nr:hypothetical protein CORMATOL_02430 [Corynebacterium matruchotii ATCC 33806]
MLAVGPNPSPLCDALPVAKAGLASDPATRRDLFCPTPAWPSPPSRAFALAGVLFGNSGLPRKKTPENRNPS